jgi:two-component system cell cycle sensor histidine kinase/response regulator CckA
MKDQSKTKQVLIQELASLKQKIADLEKAETERKRLEEDLAEERDKLKTLSDNAPFAMVLINKQGHFTYINAKFKELFGFDLSDVPDGRAWFRKAYPDAEYRHTVISAWVEDFRDAKPGERKPRVFTVTCKDRTEKIVNFIPSRLISGDYLMTCKNITDHMRAAAALRDSEEQYRNLFRNHAAVKFLIDPDTGIIIESNEAAVNYYGWSHEQLKQMRIQEINTLPPEEVRKEMENARINKRIHFEFRHRQADGSIRDVEVYSSKVKLKGKEFLHSIIHDITGRKQAEKALRESEERWQFALEGAGDGVWDWNAQTNEVFFSRQWKAMLGYGDDEIGNTLDEWDRRIHPEDRKRCYDDLDGHFNGKTPVYLNEHRLLCKDGGYKWILDRGKVIDWMEDGKPRRVIGTHTDITERKQMEAALRKSEAEKTVILESVSDMIFYIDTDMLVIYSNLAMEKFFNLPSGHLEGKTCYNTLHHRDKPCSVCPALEAMQSGKPHESYISSLGRHWRLSGYPVRDESGAIVGAIEAVSDITDLRNTEEKYRSIFDNAMEGIYQSTPDGRLISVNPALAKIFGYDSPEIMMSEVTNVERSIYDDPDRRQAFLNLAEEQGIAKNFEFEGSKKNGELIYVSDNSRAVKDSKGNTIYYEGIIQDITDRKRAEDALRASEERFRTLSENAPDIIYTLNLEGAITYANPSWKRVLGHDEEDLMGHYFTDFAREEDRRAYRKLFKGIRDDSNIVSNYIGVILTKDGAERVFNMNSAFNRDSKGCIIGVLGTLKDITEQREMEKKLSQAQKMEAIGTLAGGIAHDFNNLLMGIQGYASLMLLDLDASHPHYERLKRIEQQVQSGANLTKQLLGFARGGRYEARPTDINEIIDRTASIFGRTKKEIAVHRSLAKDLWTVDVDQGQMEQVFMNLYVNAWQAMPGGGELYLETGNFLLDDDLLMSYTIKPGRYIKISVTDTGTGMDANTRERIFDPFFTTKAMGRGTGLGLATVYGIIKGHKGMIDVTSEPSQGTTFDIYLPASEKTIDKEKTAATEIMTGTETVLLVDDEQMVLEVTRELLESMGYRVYAVGSGQEAIAVYMEKRNDIDLVILDMIMPGISGGETFDRLHEINPDAKVLLSSGYSISGQAQQILERGCNGFLQKPFHLENLSQKVREVLSG